MLSRGKRRGQYNLGDGVSAMKALVTGGCGFIGSHLVERLVSEGHDVRVLDDLSTGRVANIEALAASGAVELIQGRVQDPRAAAEAVDGRTHVFHLAALADIVPSIVSPMAYFDTNVNGTAVILEAARLAGVEKFLYAASSSCYGIPDEYPTKESAEIRPQYPYAFTKWAGEETVKHWGQVYGLPYVCLRLFNVYGPRSRTSGTYGAVFGVFLAQKLAGQPMTIVGDGTQSRDFTFVTDVTAAFTAAAQSDLTSAVMNVGSGGAYPVNLLTELLGGPTVNIPKRPGEPDVTLADTSRIHADLGWAPKVPFEQGVEIMLENIEYWRDAPVWDPEAIADATALWFDHLGPGK